MNLPAIKLGYMVVESEKLDEWEVFTRDGLGMHADRLSPDLLALRIDDRERRMVVVRGPAEDVVAMGWELEDAEAYAALTNSLRAQGIALDGGPSGAAAQRGVAEMAGYSTLKGLRFEFFHSPKRTNQPLDSKVSRFKTGDGGMGHAALFTRNPESFIAQMQNLFGARISDTITDKLQGIEIEFTFLHFNERHHSLAIAATAGKRIDPIAKRVQHIMIEAETLDDVSDAYLRCKRLGYPIAMGMGQHPNDKGKSFYVIGPSGFEVELGCEPVLIGDNWEVREYRGISKWGHKPEFKLSLRQKLGALVTAVRSLRRED